MEGIFILLPQKNDQTEGNQKWKVQENRNFTLKAVLPEKKCYHVMTYKKVVILILNESKTANKKFTTIQVLNYVKSDLRTDQWGCYSTKIIAAYMNDIRTFK